MDVFAAIRGVVVPVAVACWPSTPGSLLCLDDPWNKQLHRVALPHVQPPAITDPIAMVLDDGTRCRLRNGGAWAGRDDGFVGVYGFIAQIITRRGVSIYP